MSFIRNLFLSTPELNCLAFRGPINVFAIWPLHNILKLPSGMNVAWNSILGLH